MPIIQPQKQSLSGSFIYISISYLSVPIIQRIGHVWQQVFSSFLFFLKKKINYIYQNALEFFFFFN
jgi:hypothetical protein